MFEKSCIVPVGGIDTSQHNWCIVQATLHNDKSSILIGYGVRLDKLYLPANQNCSPSTFSLEFRVENLGKTIPFKSSVIPLTKVRLL